MPGAPSAAPAPAAAPAPSAVPQPVPVAAPAAVTPPAANPDVAYFYQELKTPSTARGHEHFDARNKTIEVYRPKFGGHKGDPRWVLNRTNWIEHFRVFESLELCRRVPSTG